MSPPSIPMKKVLRAGAAGRVSVHMGRTPPIQRLSTEDLKPLTLTMNGPLPEPHLA